MKDLLDILIDIFEAWYISEQHAAEISTFVLR